MEEDKKKKINDIKDNIKSLKTDLKKICNICQKVLGYPTEDELRENDFL